MKRLDWIPAAALALSAALGCVGHPGSPPKGRDKPAADPGRVTLHRLNRVEYGNTARDLLRADLAPAADFPSDDSSYGFDNIADVLTLSPLQLELYERAAEKLAEAALALPILDETKHVEAETLTGDVGTATNAAWELWGAGEIGALVQLPADGSYTISVRVWGDQVPPDPVMMRLHAGKQSLGPFAVAATAESPVVAQATLPMKAGPQRVTVEFLNEIVGPPMMLQRNLYVDWIEVLGPHGLPTANPIRDGIVTCDPSGDACVRSVIEAFATRAWRRPLTSAEVDQLVSFVALAKSQGDSVNEGLKLAMRAALVAPSFLFRVELDPDPTSTTPHSLSDYELASRLSYFLWSSMPDEELFAAAKAGKLGSSAEVEAQVARMLGDPNSAALTDNFAGQWLSFRALADHEIDSAAYPAFDAPLRAAMGAESRLFFQEILGGDAGIDQMLTADFTYVNDRLAQHYGLPAVGPDMTRVVVSGDARGGLLRQGGLLTVTSYPTRSTPVKRGKWLLANLLCAEPPPPPPGVAVIAAQRKPSGSFRDRLEEHIQNPACRSCHETMDALGFALDHYDGVGAWRDQDQGFPVDAKGQLPGGAAFDGATAMASLIAKDPRFAACTVQKMLTYALGRGPAPSDKPHLDTIAAAFVAGGFKLKSLPSLIAQSDAFRLRRGEPLGVGATP